MVAEGICSKILSTGESCGMPTENKRPKCVFHETLLFDSQNHDHLRYLERYIRGAVGAQVDLTGKAFRGIRFEGIYATVKPMRFADCTFESCDFHGTLNDPNFAGAKFKNSVFSSVIFQGNEIDFSGATFEGTVAPFQLCNFKAGKLLFNRAVLASQGVLFDQSAAILRTLDFSDSLITVQRFQLMIGERNNTNWLSKYRDFLVVWADQISFDRMRFYGFFEYTNHEDYLNKAPLLSFRRVNFSRMQSAQFDRANLSRCSLWDAELSNANFVHVWWGDKGDRRILYDDLVLPEERDDRTWNELRRQYVQLKKNYQDRYDYPRSNQWFFRETDCRLRVHQMRKPKGLWSKIERPVMIFAFRLYRAASEYGDDFVKPVLGLAISFFVFGFLYFYAGFDIDSTCSVNYDFSSSIAWENVADYFRAVGFAVAAVALQVGRTMRPQGLDGILIYVIQLVFSFTLISLFLLALRRAFRR